MIKILSSVLYLTEGEKKLKARVFKLANYYNINNFPGMVFGQYRILLFYSFDFINDIFQVYSSITRLS